MKAPAIVLVALAVSLFCFPLSAFAGCGASGSESLGGSVFLPGISAKWGGVVHEEGVRVRSFVDFFGSFEGFQFIHGTYYFSSLPQDLTKFYGGFRWEGTFGENDGRNRNSSMWVHRGGADVNLACSVSSITDNLLGLSAYASIAPAVLVLDSFDYYDSHIFIGCDPDTGQPIIVPGWTVEFEFSGRWLPTDTLTAEQVGALFLVPEPATMALLAMGGTIGAARLATKRRYLRQ